MCTIDKESFGPEAWLEQSFEFSFPDKLLLSRVALHAGRPVGYLIASRYACERAHIHRLVVLSSFGRRGTGDKLPKSFESACLRIGINEITLESLNDRHDANCFYEHMGFRAISGNKLENYLKEKGKTAHAQRYSEVSSSGKVRVYSKSLVHSLENPKQLGDQEQR